MDEACISGWALPFWIGKYKVVSMTSEEFFANRHEMPDGGRWTELVLGEPRVLHPPDQQYGDVVLNFSRQIAKIIEPGQPLFAEFGVGIQTMRGPDTVRFPAVSLFNSGKRFAHLELMLSETVPAVVVEIVSSNDRRTTIAERIYEYREVGIPKIWVIDPHAQEVTVVSGVEQPISYSVRDRIVDGDMSPKMDILVGSLFGEPPWWKG